MSAHATLQTLADDLTADAAGRLRLKRWISVLNFARERIRFGATLYATLGLLRTYTMPSDSNCHIVPADGLPLYLVTSMVLTSSHTDAGPWELFFGF